MDVELKVAHGKKYYYPAVLEGITWTTARHGSPGQLDFTVANTKGLKMEEGDAVSLVVDGDKVFFGFIFKMKRSKNDQVSVTAYDQLRYLKNKDTYVYSGKTASQVIKMIANDFRLQTGTLADTKYKIPTRTESNTTLFDMIENALALTTQNKSKMYVLYDDFGKLTLKSITDMKVKTKGGYFIITDGSAEDYSLTSSIDKDTYNQVKLAFDNKKTGQRDNFVVRSTENINKWGLLQYYEKLQEGENGKEKASALLKLYNAKNRALSIENAAGHNGVRGGSMILVQLDTGDVKINNWMLVEKAKHVYKNGHHTMSLDVRGGEINNA